MIHIMKNIFKFITIGIALLAGSMTAYAQYNTEGGVSTAKNVTGPDEDGYYTISLETFATGESTQTEKGIPVDIVLVLDVSGSMNDYLYNYTARPSQSYSYTGYGNNSYYYLHTDGQYYEVELDGRRLRFQVGNQWYYLYGTGVQTNRPSQVSGYNTPIWTGVLYNRVSRGMNKMTALKNAVTTFVNEVHHNALYDKDGNLRGTPLTNQISIVKFASDRYYSNNNPSESSIAEGNHMGAGSDSGAHNASNSYNYTEVLKGFKDVSTDAGVNSLIQQNQNGINAITAGGGTAAHYGLTKATYLLETVKNRESTKVVVFFTDGIPGMSGWDNTFANGAISAANTIKKAVDQGGYGATIYSIGVFDNLGTDAANANRYMHSVSSDYPNATSMTNYGTGGSDANGYYQDASNADLDAIFKDIAGAASQSDATVGTSTQVRDVVSSSFVLPEGADTDDVTFYTMDITEDGSDWENQQTPAGVSAVFKDTTGTDGVKRKMLSVEGFDFSKEDTVDENGFTTRANAGNFVGIRYKSKTETFWAGKKLVIEFKVLANSEATGGDGSATNHPDSGVYVYNEETKTYTAINHYPMPHTDLPLLIKITKDGLRHGESATFEIHMAEPLVDTLKTADNRDSLVIRYNAIGKPMPNESTWGNWSKVILTNKGADGDPVTKVLRALDPHYVYRIVEDDWGWAYELTGTGTTFTTAEVEVNPFTFHNQEKTGIVKHAEAVSINHFATSATGEANEEHYKSSKTDFKSTNQSGSSSSSGSESGSE